MKTLISTFLFSMFFMIGSAQSISDQNTDNYNYVVISKTIRQLHPTLLAAEALKKEDGKNFGKFEIIVCGKNIGELTEPDKIEEFYARAQNQGVSIIACGFSLNKFNVDRDKLPKDMRIVENGILHTLELQKKNYLTLEL